jgi:outer membrane protein insertion porin family
VASTAEAETHQKTVVDLSQQMSGKTVSSISFEAPLVGLSSEELLSTTKLEPGNVLSPYSLEQAVGYLERRGIFENVDIETIVNGNQIELTFLLTPSLLIRNVRFSGNVSLTREELKRMARIRPQSLFKLESVAGAKARILEGYEEAGFFAPSIRIEYRQLSDSPLISVVFVIDEGYRSRIANITLNGSFPPDTLDVRERFLGYATGRDASQSNLKELGTILLAGLRKEGYLEAFVRIERLVYEPLSGDVNIQYKVETRDPLTLNFVGNNLLSTAELLDLLRIDTRTVPFGPNAIPNLSRLIKKKYQENGYYKVSVGINQKKKAGNRRIFELTINEGKRYHIEKISFEGLNETTPVELKNQMLTSEKKLFPFSHWFPGYLIEETLEDDIFNLQEYYFSLGFLNAQVRANPVEINDDDELELTILVSENPQSYLETVEIVWEDLVQTEPSEWARTAQLLSLTSQISDGIPYDDRTIENERKRLLREVEALGHPNARVKSVYKHEDSRLSYFITPGKQTTISNVIIRGNRNTHDYVIERELLISPGEKWEPKKIRESEQGLYRLGVFRNANIHAEDNKIDESNETLVVDLSERDTGSIELGAGFNTEEGIGISTELAQRNLYGTGNRLSLSINGFFNSGSQFLDAGRVQLSFTNPRLFSTRIRFLAEIFLQNEVQFIDEFSFDRVGGTSTFSYPLAKGATLSLSASVFHEEVFDVPSDIILSEDDEGSTFYSMLSSQLRYDRRDDVFNPRSGFLTSIGGRWLAPAIGSDVSFFGINARATTYLPLSDNFTWATNLNFQIKEPFGNTDAIPLSRRLYLGGRSTLRGFSPHSIGPRGVDGNVAGGDRSLVLSSELLYDFKNNIVALVFLDAGNTRLAHEGTFIGDPESLTSLRYSPGFGVRYRTPIGPLGFDVGFPLSRRKHEQFARIYLNIGGPM